jgi:glucan phosphoethanolaminetransferase (alkaline phosphatase superfamily)
MPTERLIFTIVSVPVLLLALFFLVVAPFKVVSALRSSTSREIRVPATWLAAAWILFVAILVAYFVSGWWYRENIVIRPVDPLEVFALLIVLVFGIHLPSVGYGRLRKARKKARAAESP